MKRLPVFCFVLFIISCNLATPNRRDNQVTQRPYVSHWIYDTNVDRMTSHKTYDAYITAQQGLNFRDPYKGMAYADIQLTYAEDDHTNYVWLVISNGEFTEPPEHFLSLRIRFDSAQPENYRFFFPANGHTKDIGFKLSDANRFIEKVKHTKKILIEAPFYKEGIYVLEFNVEGLTWNYKGKEGDDTPRAVVSGVGSSGQTQTQGRENLFDRLFIKPNTANNTTIRSTVISGSGSNAMSETNINGAVVSTREKIDKANNTVTIRCVYKNNTGEDRAVAIKAYFLDVSGNVLTVKTVTISCSVNSEVSTNLSADGVVDKYKSYKIEIE